ncbi:hypothetical protein [uncultured Mycobacterium sp.]
MVQLLIGHTPGGISADRYREAWVQHTLDVLRHNAAQPPNDP